MRPAASIALALLLFAAACSDDDAFPADDTDVPAETDGDAADVPADTATGTDDGTARSPWRYWAGPST